MMPRDIPETTASLLSAGLPKGHVDAGDAPHPAVPEIEPQPREFPGIAEADPPSMGGEVEALAGKRAASGEQKEYG
jgi:hypothetical protein